MPILQLKSSNENLDKLRTQPWFERSFATLATVVSVDELQYCQANDFPIGKTLILLNSPGVVDYNSQMLSLYVDSPPSNELSKKFYPLLQQLLCKQKPATAEYALMCVPMISRILPYLWSQNRHFLYLGGSSGHFVCLPSDEKVAILDYKFRKSKGTKIQYLTDEELGKLREMMFVSATAAAPRAGTASTTTRYSFLNEFPEAIPLRPRTVRDETL